jgi:hypothetical protein
MFYLYGLSLYDQMLPLVLQKHHEKARFADRVHRFSTGTQFSDRGLMGGI